MQKRVHTASQDLPSLFYEKCKQACPELSDEARIALCELWEHERKLIIDRMMQLSETSVGAAIHINARPAAIFEMAKLNLFLVDRMLESKLRDGKSGGLDPDKEAQFAKTVGYRTRIENTARILSEHVWNKCVADFRKRWPLLIEDSAQTKRARKGLIHPDNRPTRVRRNHFSPVFCNRLWADSKRMIRVYTRKVDGGITSFTRSYTQWGAKDNLYSNRLEAYLGLVDDDGASSHRKLLNLEPLSDLDKRRWIAFLVIQLIRTPSALKQITSGLKKVLPRISPTYPSDQKSLKNAYETLFQNNDVYAHFHRLMAPRTWSIFRSPESASFVRADNPVTVEGMSSNRTWRLIYPMAPSSLFVVGPELGGGYDADFVGVRTITHAEVLDVNQRLASSAAESVIACPGDSDAELCKLLEKYMGSRCRYNLMDDIGLWGPLFK